MKCLPRRCREYLDNKSIEFTEVVENRTSALLILNYKLPPHKFDHETVTLLLLLPEGYPDSSPDMFYMNPWIKVQGSTNWPKTASEEKTFLGVSWQRWSSHWSDWRQGTDGIRTWLLKIRAALERA